MQTNVEYLTSLTVPAIKAILNDFNATGISKSRKPELVRFAATMLDGAHLDAIAFEAESDAKMIESVEAMVSEAFPPSMAEIDAEYRKSLLSEVAKGALAAGRMVNRINGYMRNNGTDKLTKAQLRRVRKQANRHGIDPWKLSYDFTF